MNLQIALNRTIGSELPALAFLDNAPFYKEFFNPVKAREGKYPWVKPGRGGLWTSPLWIDGCGEAYDEYGGSCDGKCLTAWQCWCANNDYREEVNQTCWINGIELYADARVLVIDSYQDLLSALKVYAVEWSEEGDIRDDYYTGRYLDFERIAQEEDYHAIWLTREGQYATHYPDGEKWEGMQFPPDLYGWDCETVLVLNSDAIRSSWVVREGQYEIDSKPKKGQKVDA